MDKFGKVLNIASKQTNLGFGLISLLTAGGEQLFSSALFKCPCNELNFVYGMVFLLVPALALLLLGFILSKKMWKLVTGLCQHRAQLSRWKRLSTCGRIFFQISCTALVAPSSWIAVALLSGSYFECAMSRSGIPAYNKKLCGGDNERCLAQLHKFPCGSKEPEKDAVLLNLRAQSQILGWLLIASIMLFNLLMTCAARCSSPISYFQLKFWRAYAQEESALMDTYTTKHAKELAERNLKSFFCQKLPENITTPSNQSWEKISSLYKFSTRDHYYSTLHQYVERCNECEGDMMRMSSVRSNSSANPAVLNFVDDGRMML